MAFCKAVLSVNTVCTSGRRYQRQSELRAARQRPCQAKRGKEEDSRQRRGVAATKRRFVIAPVVVSDSVTTVRCRART